MLKDKIIKIKQNRLINSHKTVILEKLQKNT